MGSRGSSVILNTGPRPGAPTVLSNFGSLFYYDAANFKLTQDANALAQKNMDSINANALKALQTKNPFANTILAKDSNTTSVAAAKSYLKTVNNGPMLASISNVKGMLGKTYLGANVTKNGLESRNVDTDQGLKKDLNVTPGIQKMINKKTALNKLNAENSQAAKVNDSKFANDAGKVNNNYKDSSLVKDTNNNPDVKTVNRNLRVVDTKFDKDVNKIDKDFKNSKLFEDMTNNPNVSSINKKFLGRKTYTGIPTSVAKGQPFYVSPRKPGNSGPLPLP